MERVIQLLEIGFPKEVYIDSEELWNPTGIWLEVGSTYDLQVIPDTQTWTDGKLFSKTCKADGFSNFVLDWFSYLKRSPKNKWFTLMGVIEKDEATCFAIGLECINYKPATSGELNCFANDAWKHYGNNKGKLNLTVTRRS